MKMFGTFLQLFKLLLHLRSLGIISTKYKHTKLILLDIKFGLSSSL